MSADTPGKHTEADGPARIVLITGLSGAGKSTAAKCFEDLGYYCVDKPPSAPTPSLPGGSGAPSS